MASPTPLSDLIDAHKEWLVRRWKDIVAERLGLDMDLSEFVDHLPQFLDALVSALGGTLPPDPVLENARIHGRERRQAGHRLQTLTREVFLVVEAIFDLCESKGQEPTLAQTRRLCEFVSRATSQSAAAYAERRDAEMVQMAEAHFSFLAHRLRSPLQTAHLAASMLPQVESEPRRTHLIGSVQKSLNRLSEAIDEDLVRGGSGQVQGLEIARLNARDWVADAIDGYADRARAKGLSIETDVEDFEFDGDFDVLRGALANLVDNAVRYSGAGRVHIRGRVQQDRARLEVEDACGGISESFVSRLFEPFTGLDAARPGLGLMIAQRAAQAHGGTVHFHNQPPHGCVFSIELPLRQT